MNIDLLSRLLFPSLLKFTEKNMFQCSIVPSSLRVSMQEICEIAHFEIPSKPPLRNNSVACFILVSVAPARPYDPDSSPVPQLLLSGIMKDFSSAAEDARKARRRSGEEQLSVSGGEGGGERKGGGVRRRATLQRAKSQHVPSVSAPLWGGVRARGRCDV